MAPNRGMDTIGKRLARARKESGMSQPELARIAGVSAGAVGNIEAGTRSGSARVVEALARALGVSVRWLVDGDGPREQVGAWPFSQVDRSAIESLSPSQKAAVEGAILLVLAQMGASGKDLAA